MSRTAALDRAGTGSSTRGPAAGAWPVVVVTTFFPSSVEPQRTVFVKNLVLAMRARRDVSVVSPTPKRPWPLPSRHLPPEAEVFEGIEVTRPRFVAIPGLSWLNGLAYFAAIVRPLAALRRERGPFVVHAHCAYPDGVGVALAARWVGLPCVVTAHGSDLNVYAERPLLRRQIAWSLKRVSAVIGVSRALCGKIATLVGSAPTAQAFIPCAGFDAAVFAPRDRAATRAGRGLDPSARVAVFVGQLVPLKQVDRLVEAWRLLSGRGVLSPADRLVVMGAGPEGPGLERQVAAAGLAGSVLFTGVRPQSEVSDWVGCADVLCLPSRIEGTPNVIVEALASGVPVVASRVGGIPELLTDGENGYLVAPGDSQALADRIHLCFGRAWDPQAVRRSVEHLTWGALAARNLELIDTITSKATHASAG